MMKQFTKYSLLFFVGAIGYMTLELLFRGHTHYTMGILGGICFILIGLINSIFSFELSLIKQMLLSAVIVTLLEFISGLILNVYLNLGIWDYSELPFNVMGQISLLFTVIWFFLSPVAIVLDDLIRWKLFDEKKPYYKL